MKDPRPRPDPERHPIVQIDQIVKKFPGPTRGSEVVALDGISLTVARGEFVALLGPSGCGKTTLLRILAGQETATAGRVVIDGQEMTGVPPERRPVNMVFQTHALFPHLNVFENIAFGPRMKGMPAEEIRRRVAQMLALVRLEGFEQRRVTQLSGGQAQRVALARALINQPKVLLLDEPLASLDLKLRKAMQLELKAIHRALGTTFIYVTHDQEEAITMADRIVIMDHGRIVQDGTPFEIYHRPSSVFASQFIGESNVLPATVAEQRDDAIVVDVGGVHVHAVAGPAVKPGQAVWVSIRPEQISLQPADAVDARERVNRFAGEIVDVIFLGPLVRYEVTLPTGVRLMAIEGFRDDRPLFAPGAAVQVCWQREHCLVLTA